MAQNDPSKIPIEQPSYGTFIPPYSQHITIQPSIPFPTSPNFYQNPNPYHSVPVGYHYATVVEGVPVRERRLPCCGIGIGWILIYNRHLKSFYSLLNSLNTVCILELIILLFHICIYLSVVQNATLGLINLVSGFWCGFFAGIPWFLCGFFFAGVPWYIGASILLCVGVDYREKAGLIACAIGAALLAFALFFGLTNDNLLDW